jgi:hypothetical protein
MVTLTVPVPPPPQFTVHPVTPTGPLQDEKEKENATSKRVVRYGRTLKRIMDTPHSQKKIAAAPRVREFSKT